MGMTLACEFDTGDDIGEAVRQMVEAADRLGVGLHCTMNDILFVVQPGDSAETLLDYWTAVRATRGKSKMVCSALARKAMS